jgi:hypothetical protein
MLGLEGDNDCVDVVGIIGKIRIQVSWRVGCLVQSVWIQGLFTRRYITQTLRAGLLKSLSAT